MTPTDPRAETSSIPAASDEGTGIAGVRSWNTLYVFVVAVFFLWVVLLQILTRAFS